MVKHIKKQEILLLLLIFTIPILLLLCLAVYGTIYLLSHEYLRSHYLTKYNKAEIRVVEDSNFPFYKEGHSSSYKLNSKYYVSHRILLIPDSKSIPTCYEYKGDFRIEIYSSQGQLLYTCETSQPETILRARNNDSFETYLIYTGENTKTVRPAGFDFWVHL